MISLKIILRYVSWPWSLFRSAAFVMALLVMDNSLKRFARRADRRAALDTRKLPGTGGGGRAWRGGGCGIQCKETEEKKGAESKVKKRTFWKKISQIKRETENLYRYFLVEQTLSFQTFCVYVQIGDDLTGFMVHGWAVKSDLQFESNLAFFWHCLW